MWQIELNDKFSAASHKTPFPFVTHDECKSLLPLAGFKKIRFSIRYLKF